MTEHRFVGWAKVPSRRGGLRAPKCSCGWKGGPQRAADGTGSFDAHVTDEEVPRCETCREPLVQASGLGKGPGQWVHAFAEDADHDAVTSLLPVRQ